MDTKKQKGQISLFFATTLFVLMSFLAFVINIGIFVKVKINLQNAVDAAAFAGASVQARQLTNISHLNFEMRNVYKEWMLKYYVLGNLNINDVAGNPSGDTTKFNMQTYNNSAANVSDRYNVPSGCIDFAGQGVTALCKNYVIPGLPRFKPINVGSLDQTTNSILDTLTSEKNKDCALRSQINFLTITLWAYNVQTSEKNALQTLAPEIGSEASGAFPRAFELGLRMRSLEAHMNEPPELDGVCLQPNDSNSDFCSQSINNVIDGGRAGKERINKAFFSGVRNLGGSEGDESEELRRSFTLRELPPQPYKDESLQSTSNLLIPQTSSTFQDKYYVDLKLMTLNLATFYTIFTSLKDDITFQGSTIDTEAACASTKTGLPIPGYPLGFVKNPNVLTYYAVEGKAKFIGMFNPFDDDGGIMISAYAAAKPFGGRVGPMLFDMSDSSAVRPRVTSGGAVKKISSAFLTGMKSTSFVDRKGQTLAPGQYAPGAPLPVDPTGSAFWQSAQDAAVGGWLDDESKIVFAVPNLIYDYPNGSPDEGGYFDDENITVLDPSNPAQELKSGLYNAAMFRKFKANLASTSPSVGQIGDAFLSVRAPTKWDANNYLIPSPEEMNSSLGLDSFGLVGAAENPQSLPNGTRYYNMSLYAPLYGPNALLSNANEVEGVLNDYLGKQILAVKKYIKSMNSAASSIYLENSSAATGGNLGEAAAKLISDIDVSYLSSQAASQSDDAKPTCASIAGKFAYFYLGNRALDLGVLANTTGCVPAGVDPEDSYLVGMMKKYFSTNIDNDFFNTTLSIKDDTKDIIFSAYRPGPQNDASASGIWNNAVRSDSQNMKRNFYSSKFVTLKSLQSGSSPTFLESSNGAGIPIHSEGQ